MAIRHRDRDRLHLPTAVSFISPLLTFHMPFGAVSRVPNPPECSGPSTPNSILLGCIMHEHWPPAPSGPGYWWACSLARFSRVCLCFCATERAPRAPCPTRHRNDYSSSLIRRAFHARMLHSDSNRPKRIIILSVLSADGLPRHLSLICGASRDIAVSNR